MFTIYINDTFRGEFRTAREAIDAVRDFVYNKGLGYIGFVVNPNGVKIHTSTTSMPR